MVFPKTFRYIEQISALFQNLLSLLITVGKYHLLDKGRGRQPFGNTIYVSVCACSQRERERELHSVVLEFQPILVKVSGLDKNLSRVGCGPRARGCQPLDKGVP